MWPFLFFIVKCISQLYNLSLGLSDDSLQLDSFLLYLFTKRSMLQVVSSLGDVRKLMSPFDLLWVILTLYHLGEKNVSSENSVVGSFVISKYLSRAIL